MISQLQIKMLFLKRKLISGKYQRGKNGRGYRHYCRKNANGVFPSHIIWSNPTSLNTYAVTGTLHGSIIEAINEGQARSIFHKAYKGESILYVKDISNYNLSNI